MRRSKAFSPSSRGTSAKADAYRSALYSASRISARTDGSSSGSHDPAAAQGNVGAASSAGTWYQGYPPKTSSADSPDSATVDCFLISRNSRYAEVHISPPVGRSWAASGAHCAATSSSADKTTVLCREPMYSAAARAYGSSWLGRSWAGWKASALPAKSTEKVASFARSRRARLSAASADTTLESRPPDSRLHNGTSATVCRCTVSVSRSRTVAAVAARSSVCGRDGKDQYVATRVPARPTTATDPSRNSSSPR